MNSDVTAPGLNSGVRAGAPQAILIITAVYVALLVAAAILILPNGDEPLWLFRLGTTLFPALVYVAGAFVFGRALFGDGQRAERSRAWRALVWLSVLPYAVLFVLSTVLVFIGHLDPEIWNAIEVLIGSLTMALLLVWAYAAHKAFLRETPAPAPASPKLLANPDVWLIVGGLMMLSSVFLNTGYETPGWQIIAWQRGWVTSEFLIRWSLWTWFNVPCIAAYTAGIALAVTACIAGARGLAGRPLAAKVAQAFLSVTLVVFWFTLTNYYGNLLYLQTVGVFFPSGTLAFSYVTAAWVGMFVLGVVLWFRSRNRADLYGRLVRTMLLLWCLPMLPMTLATLWYPGVWGIYGLILYLVGVQIVTASCWKLASAVRLPR
jgi:hypothetical protein